MKNLNVLLAIIGGAAAGAAVGMLFAPKRGSELREDVKSFIKAKCPLMKHNEVEELADRIAEELKQA